MSDQSGNGGDPKKGMQMGNRVVNVEIGRDKGKDFSSITVSDIETKMVLLNMQIPDAAVIDQTYRLGGNVMPLAAVQALCTLAFQTILTSFQIAIENIDDDEQPDTD